MEEPPCQSMGDKPVAALQPTYPAIGEVFYLALDGDAPENQPLEMVRRYGYSGKWEHKGLTARGKQVCRFKLVAVSYCRNLDEVREKLTAYGSIPEGQWNGALTAAYPKPDGNGPLGVADPSWVNSLSNTYFPCVNIGGDSGFRCADGGFGEHWRWLVKVSD